MVQLLDNINLRIIWMKSMAHITTEHDRTRYGFLECCRFSGACCQPPHYKFSKSGSGSLSALRSDLKRSRKYVAGDSNPIL